MSDEKKFKIQSNFDTSVDQENAVTQLTNNILQEKAKKQTLLGVTGSGKTFVMANMIDRLNRPALILSHNKTLAAQLYEEFKEFFPENSVRYFVSYYDYYQPEAYIPTKDLYIEKETDVNKEIENLRFGAMNSAVTRRDTIVVASVSCIYNIGSPDNYENRSIVFRVGQTIDISEISRKLVSMKYERDSFDFTTGNFRVSGDVIEIYMPYDENPIRIELWGDEIENISQIEAITKRKVRDLKEVIVFPAHSLVYDDETIKRAVEGIERDLKKSYILKKHW